MFSHSSRCSECGYTPIGPYIDNCPICAAPVLSGVGAGSWQALPVSIFTGWFVILCVGFWVHGSNWGWLLVTTGSAGTAWWFLLHESSRFLVRWLAGVYLGLWLLGIVVASQPTVLPGLANGQSMVPETPMEYLALLRPGGFQSFQRERRFRVWIKGLLLVYPLGVAPPFFLIPPLLRRFRRLVLTRLPRQTCIVSLVLWAGLVGAYAGFVVPGQVGRSLASALPQPTFFGQDQDDPEEPLLEAPRKNR